MKRSIWLLSILVLAVPALASALDLPPIVSTAWLERQGGDPALRMVDIRKPEEFRAGHIPRAINVFYGSWAIKRGGLDNQLPEDEDLADLLRGAGIGRATPVVVVGKVDTTTDQVNATRVAWTLRTSGVERVAVLDGGFNRWAAEKKPVSTEAARVEPARASPERTEQFHAARAEVQAKLGRVAIVDTRGPDFFFGVSKIPLVARPGRIPHSVSLPSAWIFTKDGEFQPREVLEAMAAGVVGPDRSAPIITYCDTGRLATGWWFVLSQVLGYRNVKMYDGSAQEWAADAALPMTRYSWK
jgi:thiosulfate/3-mercaptopyruvate sulfurtransferase